MALVPPQDARRAGPEATPRDTGTAGGDTLARLEATQRRFDAVLNNTTAAIFLMDDRQHCVYMNAAAERLTGYTFAEAQGRPLHDVVHHTRADGRPYPLAECPIDRAFPQNMQEHGEEVFVHKDGSFYPVAFTASPIRDEASRTVGTVIEVRDIRAEKASRELQSKLTRLVENSDDLIALADLDGRLTYLNDAGYRMIGLDPSRPLCGVHFGEYVAPEYREYFATQFIPAVRAEGRCHAYMQLLHMPTGRRVDVMRTTLLMRDPDTGAPIGFGTVTRDVTAAKRTEAALLEADRRKDEFIAVLAHELRNPLAPIRTAARVLANPAAGPRDQQASREVIARQVATMARLLDDLLDVSRITRGKLELRREPVQLRSVLAQAIETSQPAIEARHHRLDVTIPQVPVHLDADPVRLGQVIGNLLNNAAKYTPPGGRLGLHASLDGDRVRIEVGDSGVGLSADALAHVFDMFSQIESSRGHADGGLGIGLALAKGLVQLHGGTLTARSDGPGRGSTFTVELPVPGIGTAGSADGAPGTDAGARRRVLIVDDNRDAAETLGMLLRLDGHDVRVVHSGVAALAVLDGFTPDVAVLDIGMPGLDGYELARRIRARPLREQPLLVAVTGWGQAEDKRRALEAGFDRHYTKPVNPDRIVELVRAGTWPE